MKILNKKALHNYHILESLEAGIELFGAEVKSVRLGRVDLGQSFARIFNGQIYLINVQIFPYQNKGDQNYHLRSDRSHPTRNRKLLLHKSQIQTLAGKLSLGRLTLVPVSFYEKNNLIKVQLSLAKSKKEIDKKRALKEKDHIRRLEQELRGKE